MGDQARTEEQVASQLSVQRGIERIREALEDAFEDELRDALVCGGDYSEGRVHDYLTGVSDGHEPRVRLLFDLFEQGALDLTGALQDVPATCFFLGDSVRYQRSLDDWLALLGHPRPLAGLGGLDGDHELELWSAGDLVWSRSRSRAEDSAAFLTLVLDEPVGLWRARVRVGDLRVCAVDEWSGRDMARMIVPPGVLVTDRIRPGVEVPTDRPLLPR